MAEGNFDEQDLVGMAEDSHPEIHVSEDHPELIVSEDRPELHVSEDHPELDVSEDHPELHVSEDRPELQVSGDYPELQVSGDQLELQVSEDHRELEISENHPELQISENHSEIPDRPEIQFSEKHSGDGEVHKWPGWPGENVFRMLVPVQKVGGIIGRKGEYIKKTCEETKARIKILDGPPGTNERTVMISAKEEPDLSIPPAMDGLLKVHKRIVDVDSDPAHAPPAAGAVVSTRLLVAASQAGSLIGKQGATIKTIQDSSNCIIRVLGGGHLPLFALPDDSVVEVQGESTGVHKAVELIATHLRKFLVDRSVIGIFEMQMQNPNPRPNQDMPPPQSWGPPPQGFPMNAGGGGPGFVPNGPSPQYMPPPRQFGSFYSPPDMPPLEKQPPHAQPVYGNASIGAHTTSMPQQQSRVTKVSQNMQIPLTYADAVIGNSGANISYIRRTSGATIAVQETPGVPGEMTVEINGSGPQVQTAQQLIQNFIAEAASAAQNHTGPPGQGYNSYPGNGPMYSSQPSNPTGHGGHAPAADYGSVYGTNYGY